MGNGLVWVSAGTLVTMTVIVVLAPLLISDPYIRSDDYSVLLGEADRFWLKTLQEGRWINWLWCLRPVLFDPRAIGVVLLFLWSLTASLCGWMVFRDDERPYRALVVGLAFGLAPQMAYLTTWPATSLPAVLLLAGYTLFTVLRPGRTATNALWLFVPIALMAYTSLPFVMLLIAAASYRGTVGLREVLRLIMVFVAAFAIGVTIIFTLNWAVHGIFGIEVAAWREPAPARDLESLLRNIDRAVAWLVHDVRKMGLVQPAWTISVSALVALALIRVVFAPRGLGIVFAVAVAVVLVMSLAMVVRTGIVGAFRSSLFLFVAMMLSFALAARHATGYGRYLWPVVAIVVALPGVLHWSQVYLPLTALQAESRQIVMALMREGAADAPAIHVVGHPQAIPRGGAAQGPEQLGYRLYTLTGRSVRLCLPEEPDEPACAAAFQAAEAMPVWPDPGAIGRLEDGVLLLHLPRLAADAKVHRLPVWTVLWTEDGGGQGRPKPD